MSLIASVADFFTHFSAPKDFFWSNPIFEKDTWEGFTRNVRIVLAMGTALLVLYELRARRMGVRMSLRWRKRIGWALTLAAFGVYFDFGNPNTRYEEYYHRHELYHYYLGSKFSKEVGYTRLYECTFVAEIENGRGEATKKRDIRDLHDNLIKPWAQTKVASDPNLCKKHFTPERWESFKKDIDWFYKSAAGDYWESMQKDHGYNPPPVWTMTGKLFGSLGDASDRFFKFLAGIDIALHFAIILLFRWAFGWRIMTVATVFWGANAPADFNFTGGAFLRQDWLFLLVGALCLTRKRYFLLAGFALTWSALLRVFPGLFVVGWAVIIGLTIIERVRRGPPKHEANPGKGLLRYLHPDHRKVIAGCVLGLATLIPLSIAVCGSGSWKEFYDHTLKTHSGTPLTNHMGLPAMLVHTWDGRMRFGQDDNYDDAFEGWKAGRIERFEKMKPVWAGILVILFGWMVWALRRTKLLWVGMALSLPFVMSVENLTNYYYSMFIVGAALAAVRPMLAAPFLVTSGLGKVLQYPPSGFYYIDDRWVAGTWLYFALCIILLVGYSRPFSIERLKAWWDGKPEPRSKPARVPEPIAGTAPVAAEPTSTESAEPRASSERLPEKSEEKNSEEDPIPPPMGQKATS